MSDPASATVPAAITSPAGGAAIGALFFPTGCNEYVSLAVCAEGERTNFLGWTLGGAVGAVNQLGAVVIGFLVAGLFYVALSIYESHKTAR